MALTDKISRGMVIDFRGEPNLVIEREFYKPGKGKAYNRTKLKNLLTGKIVSQTFKSNEKVDELEVLTKNMVYLYTDGEKVYFMDPTSFEQMDVNLDLIPGGTDYLKEEEKYVMVIYEGRIISVKPPVKLVLEVTETSDAVKGNTSTNATKEAILETGVKVQVPLFVRQGEKIVINTELGTYDSKE